MYRTPAGELNKQTSVSRLGVYSQFCHIGNWSMELLLWSHRNALSARGTCGMPSMISVPLGQRALQLWWLRTWQVTVNVQPAECLLLREKRCKLEATAGFFTSFITSSTRLRVFPPEQSPTLALWWLLELSTGWLNLWRNL